MISLPTSETSLWNMEQQLITMTHNVEEIFTHWLNCLILNLLWVNSRNIWCTVQYIHTFIHYSSLILKISRYKLESLSSDGVRTTYSYLLLNLVPPALCSFWIGSCRENILSRSWTQDLSWQARTLTLRFWPITCALSIFKIIIMLIKCQPVWKFVF